MKGNYSMTFEEACKQKVKEIEKIKKQFYGCPIYKNDKSALEKRKRLELQLNEKCNTLFV